jgi:hypothetical protein
MITTAAKPMAMTGCIFGSEGIVSSGGRDDLGEYTADRLDEV